MSNFTTNPYGSPKFRDITKQCTFSWKTAPTAITAGTFPDSFIDGNHETKLEFYGTYSGATSQAQLTISLPKICQFMLFDNCGVGAQIGDYNSAYREVKADTGIASERSITVWNSYRKTASASGFSTRMRRPYQGFLQDYGDTCRLIFYSNTAGDYAFEIYSIKILELVGV